MRKHFTIQRLVAREERRGPDHVSAIVRALGSPVPMNTVLDALQKCGCPFCLQASETVRMRVEQAQRFMLRPDGEMWPLSPDPSAQRKAN